MRKVISYIAMSLNGKIADADGNVDWLEQIAKPETGDYGYAQFYDSVDIVLMGRTTYEQIIG